MRPVPHSISVCARCGRPWDPEQRTCPACGSAARRRVHQETWPRYFTAGMTEFDRAPYGARLSIPLFEVLWWLLRLPIRIRAYRRRTGLWPDRDR